MKNYPGQKVKVAVTDIDGVLRGKLIHKDKFLSAMESGSGFCDVVFGWDSNDATYDKVKFTGWHTGYPDTPVRIILSSCRSIPFEGNMLLFIAEFEGDAKLNFAIGCMFASIVWFYGLAILAARMSSLLSRTKVKRAIDLVVGLIMWGISVFLFLSWYRG